MGENLHTLFFNLQKDKLNRSELNQLIQYCLNIATSYIIFKYFSSGESKFNFDISVQDLAVDSIAPLFIINGTGKIGLVNSINNWHSDINDRHEAAFFLNKIVWNRVEQTIIKVIKQKDPIFAKIHKNLSTCVLNYNFKKINYFGTLYIVNNKIERICGKVISNEEFEKLPAHLFLKKQFELCNGILIYLINNTVFFPAIPMNQLVKRLKALHFSGNLGNDIVNNEFEHNFDIENAFVFALEKINNKIQSFYIKHNKLNEADGTAIYKSFTVISEEMKNGGINSSLYEYLNEQMHELNKKDFYKKYHGIMNYLLNDLKRNLIKFVEEKSSK